MARHSAIGMRTFDGKIKAVDCIWDNPFLDFAQSLLTSYKDVFKVNQLIDKGYISRLESTVKASTFTSDTNPITFKKEQDFIDYFNNCDYFYIFEDDYWTLSNGRNVFVKLSDIMKELNNG